MTCRVSRKNCGNRGARPPDQPPDRANARRANSARQIPGKSRTLEDSGWKKRDLMQFPQPARQARTSVERLTLVSRTVSSQTFEILTKRLRSITSAGELHTSARICAEQLTCCARQSNSIQTGPVIIISSD